LLREHGITSQVTKARGAKGRYSVSVSDDRYVDAAGILTRIGLPADKKASFEDLTATSGIIPPSREVEALRLDRATAAELEALLQARADIAGASVIVRARSSEGRSQPTATVVVQRRPEATIQLEDIREIAARVVPGIKSEDVFVSLSDPPQSGAGGQPELNATESGLVSFLGVSQVPAPEYQKHVFLFIALTVFVGALAGLSGYLIGQFTQLNRSANAEAQRKLPGLRGRVVEVEQTSDTAEENGDGDVA
jgi:type III secretory pathway lipoprotein EscJ